MKSWNEVKLFHNGDDFFTELISSIRRAQKSITLETYIFEIDALTDLVLVELQLAVWRGCEVKLLVDGIGSLFWLDELQSRCENDGLLFRAYHPLPRGLQWFTRLPEVVLESTPKLIRRYNRRNHRKTVVIDDKFFFVGSFNMSHVHSQKISGKSAWRDTGAKLEGPAIIAVQAAFDLAWAFSKHFALLPKHINYIKEKAKILEEWGFAVRLNATADFRRHLYKDLCRRIAHAERRVYITTAYFLPKRALARALTKAAQKGIDVRVIIPGPTDVPLVKWAAFHMPFKLVENGVRIYEYQTSILHAKYMIIDDWCSLGSLNLNHRSLLHDLEVEAAFVSDDTVAQMNSQFQKDLDQSKPLGLELYQQTSWWKRTLTKILFKLRYWF